MQKWELQMQNMLESQKVLYIAKKILLKEFSKTAMETALISFTGHMMLFSTVTWYVT